MELWYSQYDYNNSNDSLLTRLNKLDIQVTDEFRNAFLFVQSNPQLKSIVDMMEQLTCNLEYNEVVDDDHLYQDSVTITTSSSSSSIQHQEFYHDKVEEPELDLYYESDEDEEETVNATVTETAQQLVEEPTAAESPLPKDIFQWPFASQSISQSSSSSPIIYQDNSCTTTSIPKQFYYSKKSVQQKQQEGRNNVSLPAGYCSSKYTQLDQKNSRNLMSQQTSSDQQLNKSQDNGNTTNNAIVDSTQNVYSFADNNDLQFMIIKAPS
jgi:hypothetical protein